MSHARYRARSERPKVTDGATVFSAIAAIRSSSTFRMARPSGASDSTSACFSAATAALPPNAEWCSSAISVMMAMSGFRTEAIRAMSPLAMTPSSITA